MSRVLQCLAAHWDSHQEARKARNTSMRLFCSALPFGFALH